MSPPHPGSCYMSHFPQNMPPNPPPRPLPLASSDCLELRLRSARALGLVRVVDQARIPSLVLRTVQMLAGSNWRLSARVTESTTRDSSKLLGSYAPHFDLGIDAKPQFNFDDLPSMMDSQERGGGVSFAHRIQSLCGCGGPVACGKLVTSLGPPSWVW